MIVVTCPECGEPSIELPIDRGDRERLMCGHTAVVGT